MQPETIFVVALVTGIAFLVSGLAITRLNWRKDVPPFGRHSRALDIAMHPDRYAAPEVVPVIRMLSMVGATLLASATLSLLFEVVREVGQP